MTRRCQPVVILEITIELRGDKSVFGEQVTGAFAEILKSPCGIEIEEKYFELQDLLDADEIFLTGSAAEMIAVREILEHKDLEVTKTHTISDGEGPITKKLRAKFREIVTSDNVPED